MTEKTIDLFEEGFKKILEGMDTLGYDTAKDENFDGTARRAAKGLAQLVLDRTHVKNEMMTCWPKLFLPNTKTW